MKKWHEFIMLAAVACVFTIASALSGCKEPGAPTTQQEAAVGYQADLLNCTKNSASLAESKACEGMVDIRWHVVDGGVAK